MRLTFYGHAAFLLETEGTRIIFDPYRSPDSGGYRPIDEPADIVVCSHENDRYHSHLGQIVPPFEVIRGPEIAEDGLRVRGIRFQAVPVYETPERLPGDEVTIVHLRSEGLHLAHLGDLGHLLTEAELTPIRRAEVVLVPAGGVPTLALESMVELLGQIGPRVVIPMHYKTAGINLAIEPVERFLEAVESLGWPVLETGGSTFEVSRERLPAVPTIVRLEPCR